MFCQKCGKNIPDDAIFCPNCGTIASKEENCQSETKNNYIQDCRELIDKSSKFSLIGSILCFLFAICVFFLPILNFRIEINGFDDLIHLNNVESLEELNEISKNGYIEKSFSLFDEHKALSEQENEYGDEALLFISASPLLFAVFCVFEALISITSIADKKKAKISGAIYSEFKMDQSNYFAGIFICFCVYIFSALLVGEISKFNYLGNVGHINGVTVYIVIPILIFVAYMFFWDKKTKVLKNIIASLAQEKTK